MLERLVQCADAGGIAEFDCIHDDVLRISGRQVHFESDLALTRNLLQLDFGEIPRQAVAVHIKCSPFDRQVTGLNGRRTLICVGNILVQVVEIDDVISFRPTAKLDLI